MGSQKVIERGVGRERESFSFRTVALAAPSPWDERKPHSFFLKFCLVFV